MSGHNPHGHLSQPNSSWNSLQIPSYIPRQPQLAHMSNERPLVRSPVTWHTPAPPEALYSFISANHKNLDLNPILPSFVRGPSPFGSVDLTVQSARNSTTPSPRSLTSPPPEFPHNKLMPRSLTPNSLPNSNITPSPGVIQSTGSVREKFQSSNGSTSDRLSPVNLFIRDVRQLHLDYCKMTAAREELLAMDLEPVELVKENPYLPLKNHAVPTSPKRLSPTRPPSISNNMPSSPRSRSPPLPSLPIAGSATDIVNNHIVASGNMNMPQKPNTSETIISENSPLSLALPSPSNTTSNEDSVDSNTSKPRRKRKPNKTTRVSNDSEDSLIQKENEVASTFKPTNIEPTLKEIPEKSEIVADLEEKVNSDKKIENETNTACQSETKTTISATENEKTVKEPEVAESAPPEEHPSHPQATENHIVRTDEPTAMDESHSVIVNNIATRSDIESPVALNRSNAETNSQENLISEQTVKNTSPTNVLDSPRKRSKRKGDSDDFETIDKIAAMIASSTEEGEALQEETPPQNIQQSEQVEAQNDNTEQQSSSSKITDLTEILGTPLPTTDSNAASKVTDVTPKVKPDQSKENSFEEVENKLEEMFAGIEDEKPSCPVETPKPEVSEIQAEVTSDLGLEVTEKLTQPPPTTEEQKLGNSSQKRPHSATKSEQIPPKKKKKIAKKPSSSTSQKHKSKSSHVNKSVKSSDKSLKDKIKDEPIPDIKYKGPFIQVKSDGTINVVNTPQTEDDIEKQNKVKKSIHNHTNSDRNKIRGLHVSTLSTKYDADTADATWMCVFCKKGPHKMGLGDLFGPYIITTTCEEFSFSQNDPLDDDFISKRTKADMFQKNPNRMPVVPSIAANVSLTGGSTTNSKKKRKSNDSPNLLANSDIKSIYVGMSKVSDISYEVWMHEDCAAWSSGVHIVGARIVGLEAAVWSSTRHKCSICSLNGAVICCLQRGCNEKAHISCARTQNWTLNDNDFKTLCEKHSFPSS